jgi:hypothetical protein
MLMHMKGFFGVTVFLAGALFAADLVNAAPVNLQCPESIEVMQSATPVEDWQIHLSTMTHIFRELRIYSGHPKGGVVLDPNNADEKPTNFRWTLGDAANDLWVECAYRGAATRLIKNLPKGLHACRTAKANNTLSLYCE